MPENLRPITSVLIWQREPNLRLAFRCACCDGTGCHPHKDPAKTECGLCASTGWYGFDPKAPTCLQQGSHKVPAMQTRYTFGEEIFNPLDSGDLR